MITRMWHGRTDASAADAYSRFLQERAIPDYRATPGNQGAMVLRRNDGAVEHFMTISYWESVDAIRAFAGTDVLRARYYPEDDGFLLEKEAEVVHYDIIAKATPHAP